MDDPNKKSGQADEKCPHSHLHVNFLKKIGKAVEKAGVETVETAIDIALASAGGAFSER